jgi:hypothetical protein
MADNSDDPIMQDADVIQGARGIRMGPAQLAQIVALAAPPADATRPDPNAGMGTHSAPGHNGGAGSFPSAPDMNEAALKSTATHLADALANAPMPPVRPADLGAAPMPSSDGGSTLDALIRQGGSPLATPPAASLLSNVPAGAAGSVAAIEAWASGEMVTRSCWINAPAR